MTKLQIFILTGVGVYISFIVGIGYWASRRIKTDRDYIVAGGKLGWALSIGTIFATWFGAETCMGSSSTAFNKGILGVIADPFGAGLCLVIAGLFFAGYFRKRNYETIVDFFSERYGKKTAWVLSILYIPVYLGWIGGQLLAFGFILNSLTGFSIFVSTLIATIVILIYTYLGGMWADTLADFFQMLIILVGLLILFPTLIKDLGGISAASRIPKEYFYFYPRSGSLLDWCWYIQAWMMVGIGSLPAQDLFSRLMAPKNATISRGASIISGFLYVIIGLLPVLLGIFARLVFPESQGETVLVDIAIKYLPSPLIVLMLGALLAAIMSSADSAILAPSSIIGHNLLPLIKKKVSEEEKLKWCRRSVPFLGLFSLLLALYFKNIYRLCQEAWGVLLVGVAAPMIGGVYWKKATTAGAIFSAFFGIAFWLLVKTAKPDYPPNLIGFLASLLALIIFSQGGDGKKKA